MKLSEMNTKQLAQALCAMADPLSRITQSKELNEALSAYSTNHREDQTVLQKFSGLIEKTVPALLCTHYDDMVKVIAVMTGKSAEEINNQNGAQTIIEVKTFFDKDFSDFFTTFSAEKRGK